MSTFDQNDALKNIDTYVLRAAKFLSGSERKKLVFEAIYYHKQRVKSVSYIMKRSALGRVPALQAGGLLVSHGLAVQTKLDGETAYEQIAFYQTHKDKILALAKGGAALKRFEAKVRAKVHATPTSATVVRENPVRKVKTASLPKKSMRIAFLTTNPDPEQSLRTDIEGRAVIRALKSAGMRDKVDLRLMPAATTDDLVDALNELRPQIIHFGGHGGDEGLLFDDEEAIDPGAVDVDYDLANRILDATDHKPSLLVLNACETLKGAEIFLQTVRAVVVMNAELGDAAATLFSSSFYRALASGQSVGSALKQGKLAIETAGLEDSEVPELIVKKGVDSEKLVFLK